MHGKVRRLVRELLLIEGESRILKLDTAASIITYSRGLSIKDIIELQRQGFAGRPKLMDKADKVLMENPESNEFAECSHKWLSTLEEFTSISQKINSPITLQALENLKEYFQ